MEPDSISLDDVRGLIGAPNGWCVSIYSPTHPTTWETRQDHTRLKNLIASAKGELAAAGVDPVSIRGILAPVESFLNDEGFSLKRTYGIALFAAAGLFRSFRLAAPVREYMVASTSFHIKPLLPFCADNVHFYIVTLSPKNIRLLECSEYQVRRVEHPAIPADMQTAIPRVTTEKDLLFYTINSTGTGGKQGISHAHGIGAEDGKKDLLLFLQRVNDGILKALDGQHWPLIVAAEGYLQAIYREANRYPYFIEKGIDVNPQPLGDDDLHKRGIYVMEPYFAADRDKAARRFEVLRGEGRPIAAAGLAATVHAAFEGRIDTLFIASDGAAWGTYDEPTGTISLHERFQPGDRDLYDLAAAQTLLTKGTVYVMPDPEIPSGEAIGAILRY